MMFGKTQRYMNGGDKKHAREPLNSALNFLTAEQGAALLGPNFEPFRQSIHHVVDYFARPEGPLQLEVVGVIEQGSGNVAMLKCSRAASMLEVGRTLLGLNYGTNTDAVVNFYLRQGCHVLHYQELLDLLNRSFSDRKERVNGYAFDDQGGTCIFKCRFGSGEDICDGRKSSLGIFAGKEIVDAVFVRNFEDTFYAQHRS